jgi:hypothetical protein
MQFSSDLTSAQWQVADAIARQIVLEGADVNELRKSIAYLRAYVDRDDAGKLFFIYLKTLADNGHHISHSKSTPKYLKSIQQTCKQYLSDYQAKPDTVLQILGWAARLVFYYKNSTGDQERSNPNQSSTPVGKTVVQLALERAQQKKKR